MDGELKMLDYLNSGDVLKIRTEREITRGFLNEDIRSGHR